jgi:hypothetical protein
VQDHIARFAFRETLLFDWHDDGMRRAAA